MFRKRAGKEKDCYTWCEIPTTVWDCVEGPYRDMQIVYHKQDVAGGSSISMILETYGMNFTYDFYNFQAEEIVNQTIKKISSIIASSSFKGTDPYRVIYDQLNNWEGWSGL